MGLFLEVGVKKEWLLCMWDVFLDVGIDYCISR
jgi:hypothetical protein